MSPKIIICTLLMLAVNILDTPVESLSFTKPEISIKLLNSGFHRDLYYEINYSNDWKIFECRFMLSQQIPKGAYVNVDQLDDLVRLKQLNAIYPSFVDVELPARDASPFHVFFNLTSEHYQTISLPIHFRYHSPGVEYYVDVELELPVMYAKCKHTSTSCGCGPNLCVDEHSSTPNVSIAKDLDNLPSTCDWSQIGVDTILGSSLITKIPIGNIRLFQPVVFITLIIGWIGFAYVVFVGENTYIVSQAKFYKSKTN